MSTEPIHILLVEDNPGDARLILELLTESRNSGASYTLCHVGNLHAAIEKCSTERFDAILLDLNLPDTNGLTTLDQVASVAAQSAIIVLTGLDDDSVAFDCVQHGAQSYVTKGELTSQLLMRGIHFGIERKRVKEQFKHLTTPFINRKPMNE